jgi:cytochrome c-type biogenesis protein CcmH/NrfG
MTLLYLIPGLLLAFGLYRVAQAALCLPSGKSAEAVRNIHGKRNISERLRAALTLLARLIARLFPMGEYRRNQLAADFVRLHMSETPQEYVGTAMTKSLLLALIGLLFVSLGVPWLPLLTAVAAVLAYFQRMQTIRKRVETQNHEIEAELPRLVETMNYTLQDNRDMLAFFVKYRRVAGKALGVELDRFITDMQIGNHEAALQNMDARLGLPSFSALCAVLCGVYQGIDQHTSLLVLEQDMRTKERETLRRLMEKRPSRIKIASFILTVLMILMFMVPLILLIIGNLQAVGFLDVAFKILIVVVIGAAVLIILNAAVPNLFTGLIEKIRPESTYCRKRQITDDEGLPHGSPFFIGKETV